MTICNMAIEGGARVGYVNPDQITFQYLHGGRPAAPAAEHWEEAVAWWQSLASDSDAEYDDVVTFCRRRHPPMVTWGITPGRGIGVDGQVPTTAASASNNEEAALLAEAYQYIEGLEPGPANQRSAYRRCVYWLVHQLTARGFTRRRSGRHRPRWYGCQQRPCFGRAWI